MKRQSQRESNAQVWMILVMEVNSNAIKSLKLALQNIKMNNKMYADIEY